MKMLQDKILFAVEVARRAEIGGTFLSCGSDDAPALFFKRTEAVLHKKRLLADLKCKTRVIKVRMQITSND